MIKTENQVKIKCPMGDSVLTAKPKDKDVIGELEHKCSKCKRTWNIDYTTKIITWVDGKADATPIRKFKLNIATGKSKPIFDENTDKALLRREGA